MAQDDYGTVETPDEIWAGLAAGDAEQEGEGEASAADAGKAGEAGGADGKDASKASQAGEDASAAAKQGQQQQQDGEEGDGDGEGEDGGEDQGDDDLTEEEIAKLGKKARKERFRLQRRRQEAERRAEQAEQELARLRGEKPGEQNSAAAEQVKQPEYDGLDPKDPEPKYEDFDDPADFHKAIGAWAARVENRKDRHERAQKEQELQQKREQSTLIAEHQKRVEAVAPQYDDWEEVAFREDVPFTEHMLRAVLESEQGPHMQYYLGTHPADAKRIAGLQPWQQAREMGKLEARFEGNGAQPNKAAADGEGEDGDAGDDEANTTRPTRTASKAPDPVKPVRTGRSAPIKTAESESQEEMNARLRKAGII